MSHGFSSFNEPLRDNCSSRGSANWHYCLLHVIQSSSLSALIEPRAVLTARVPNQSNLMTVESTNFTSRSSLCRKAIQTACSFPHSNKAWGCNRGTLELCIQGLNEAHYFQFFSLILITQLCSRSKMLYIHRKTRHMTKKDTQSYWIPVSLSQSYTVLNWCRLYRMDVLGAKGKCVWLLRLRKVPTVSTVRDVIQRDGLYSRHMLCPRPYCQWLWPQQMTTDGHEGRWGSAVRVSFLLATELRTGSSTCPEITYFMLVRQKTKLFCFSYL